jgi:hypothetical protein
VLSISPVEILYPVAPHLWGEGQAEAETRLAIIEKLANFDGPTLQAILSFLHHLKTKETDESGNGHDDAAPAAQSFSAAVYAANVSDINDGK